MCLIWVQITYVTMVGPFLFMNPQFWSNHDQGALEIIFYDYLKTIILIATGMIGYNIFYYGMQGSLERISATNFPFRLSQVYTLKVRQLLKQMSQSKKNIICLFPSALTGLTKKEKRKKKRYIRKEKDHSKERIVKSL